MGDLFLHGCSDAANKRGKLDGDVKEGGVALQRGSITFWIIVVDLLQDLVHHDTERKTHLVGVGPRILDAKRADVQ